MFEGNESGMGMLPLFYGEGWRQDENAPRMLWGQGQAVRNGAQAQPAQSVFGNGAPSPFAAGNQQAEDRNRAWEQLKVQPEMLALLGGLSMLANNNGQRSFGQLVGRGALDALSGAGSMAATQLAQERQAAADAERRQMQGLQMRRMQGAVQEEERLRALKARFDSGDRSPEVMNGLFGKELLARQWAQEDAQRSLGNQMALARYRAGLERSSLGQFVPGLGGFVNTQTGVLTPVRNPDGTPVRMGAGSGYMPMDAAARKNMFDLVDMDANVGVMENAIDTAYPYGGVGTKGGTGLLEGMSPNWLIQRIDPEGVPLRAAISNFSSQIMNLLSGAAVSESEKRRLEGFLPDRYDNENTLREKMNGYREYLREKMGAFENVYGPQDTFSRTGTYGGRRGGEAGARQQPAGGPVRQKDAGGAAAIPPLPEGFVLVN